MTDATTLAFQYGLLAVVFVPALVQLWAFRRLADPYELDPVRLVLAILWGAGVVYLLTGAFAEFVAPWLGLSFLQYALFVAPVLEESTKALLPFLLYDNTRHPVSAIQDGMVSGMSFGAVEGVTYAILAIPYGWSAVAIAAVFGGTARVWFHGSSTALVARGAANGWRFGLAALGVAIGFHEVSNFLSYVLPTWTGYVVLGAGALAFWLLTAAELEYISKHEAGFLTPRSEN